MTPDDPRHGTNAGYMAGCREDCCRAATRKYHKLLVIDHANGKRRLIDATGTRRRIEGLMWLGWSGVMIAERLGVRGDEVRQIRSRSRVNRATAERVADLYDELSMKRPSERNHRERQNVSKTRNFARRHGFHPPLAWDDIDNDPAPAVYAKDADEVDEIAVRRVLHGDAALAKYLNVAERAAVVDAWRKSGRGINELARLTGWKPERYGRGEVVA